MAVVALSATGCTAATQSTPHCAATAAASVPATTTLDLSQVLVQPDGYQAPKEDSVSGPVQGVGDVRRIFTDHPEDPAFIMGHGFVRGYIRAWHQDLPGADTDPMVDLDAATLMAVVLEMDTADHASDVVGHFRSKNTEDGYQIFQVPAQLSNGYGMYAKQGEQVFTYIYGVSWACGRYTFDIMLGYANEASAEPVKALAVAQHAAVCGTLTTR